MPDGTGTVRVPSPLIVNLPLPIPVDAKSRQKVFVDPPVIHIGSGPSQVQAIQFTNNTGGTVRIWLLNVESLFAGPPKNNENKDFHIPFVVENNDTLDLDLKPDLDNGDYEYHVYCDAIPGEADGNSMPRVSCP